jgi:hypothetical protein
MHSYSVIFVKGAPAGAPAGAPPWVLHQACPGEFSFFSSGGILQVLLSCQYQLATRHNSKEDCHVFLRQRPWTCACRCITFLRPLRGHLLQQWLQEWPHRVISFYSTGHSRWKEVSSTKLQFKDRENPTWRWILDAVGCCFALLRRVCWPTLEECYEPYELCPVFSPRDILLGKVVFLKPWLLAVDTSYYY